MAADDGGQEKTEDATGKRLEEMRDKGQVAKSSEVSSLLAVFVGTFGLYIYQTYLADKLKGLAIYVFTHLNQLEINPDIFMSYIYQGALFMVILLYPVIIALFVAAIVSGYGQVGFRISTKALIPKFDKLNPLTGIKKVMISKDSAVNVAKAILKLLIIILVSYYVLKDTVALAPELVNYPILEVVSFLVSSAFSFIWKISMVFLFFAVADFTYMKWKFKQDAKMTKQEVKEENKQMEGDPLIKGKIRSKQFEMARKRMMAEVPDASVVITNPTHYAVALKYEMGQKGAPVVVAKGMNEVAQRIKEIAKAHDVPIYEDRMLARALYKFCEIGEEIPPDLFKAVAQILAYIYGLRKNRKKSIA